MSTSKPRLLIVSFIGVAGGSHNFWRHLVADSAVREAIEPHVLAPRGYRTADPAAFADGVVTFHALTELAAPALGERLMRRMMGRAIPYATRWRTRLEAITPDLVLFNLAGMGEINWCVPAGEAYAAVAAVRPDGANEADGPLSSPGKDGRARRGGSGAL